MERSFAYGSPGISRDNYNVALLVLFTLTIGAWKTPAPITVPSLQCDCQRQGAPGRALTIMPVLLQLTFFIDLSA